MLTFLHKWSDQRAKTGGSSNHRGCWLRQSFPQNLGHKKVALNFWTQGILITFGLALSDQGGCGRAQRVLLYCSALS